MYFGIPDRRMDGQTDRDINLEELISLPSPPRINFSVRLSVWLSICLYDILFGYRQKDLAVKLLTVDGLVMGGQSLGGRQD
jgi:hypothetical protein